LILLGWNQVNSFPSQSY